MRYFKLNNFILLVLVSLFMGINNANASPIIQSSKSTHSNNPVDGAKHKDSNHQHSEAHELKTSKHHVTVRLNKIEAIKLSKKSGDNLYINITQSSNMSPSLTTRMPEKPTLWFSKQSPELKNLLVWQGNVLDNEEIKLIFSLVEQDFSAWDIDNLIGSAQLVLSNQHGKLEKKWELPIFEENTVMTSKGNVIEYRMKGENSDYQVSFSLQENQETKRNQERGSNQDKQDIRDKHKQEKLSAQKEKSQ